MDTTLFDLATSAVHCDEEAAGLIPYMLDIEDLDGAVAQLNKSYAHGGGWRDFDGFLLVPHLVPGIAGRPDLFLEYPGDPPLPRRWSARFRDEAIAVFDYSWVAVIQRDGSFRVCRMD
jgi:hypothetical protein